MIKDVKKAYNKFIGKNYFNTLDDSDLFNFDSIKMDQTF
jgi:hypothetical protein